MIESARTTATIKRTGRAEAVHELYYEITQTRLLCNFSLVTQLFAFSNPCTFSRTRGPKALFESIQKQKVTEPS